MNDININKKLTLAYIDREKAVNQFYYGSWKEILSGFDTIFATIPTTSIALTPILKLITNSAHLYNKIDIIFTPEPKDNPKQIKKFCEAWSKDFPKIQTFTIPNKIYETLFFIAKETYIKRVIQPTEGFIYEKKQLLEFYENILEQILLTRIPYYKYLQGEHYIT